MYTVPEKKKKKNGGVAPVEVADMYSVPDKTKKKQNEMVSVCYNYLKVTFISWYTF